jgi:hypothetical protein
VGEVLLFAFARLRRRGGAACVKIEVHGPSITKQDIDAAASDRAVDFLASLILNADLEPQVRKYLAVVIYELLSGKRKFPRRRPTERDLELVKFSIAEEVMGVMTRTGCDKVSAAVAQVSQDRKLGERTVWNYWTEYESLARASAWVKSVIPDSADKEEIYAEEWRAHLKSLQQSRD